jgi:hypothetical protein
VSAAGQGGRPTPDPAGRSELAEQAALLAARHESYVIARAMTVEASRLYHALRHNDRHA